MLQVGSLLYLPTVYNILKIEIFLYRLLMSFMQKDIEVYLKQ